MKHNMKLQPKYYNFMLNGTKRIEIRLNDEKRKNINLGYTIIFTNTSTNESFNTKVIGLLNYRAFEDMLKDFDMSILADKSITKNELINVLEEFYSKEMQEKYGVLGIRIELL